LVRPFGVSDEVIPPISLGWLATQIRAYHNVSILDALRGRLRADTIAEIVNRNNIDVVGFQIWTKDIHEVKDVSRAIKSKCPETRIILGGCHPTVLPVETMKFFGETIDFAFKGEGEIGFRLFLDALSSDGERKNFENIPGLVWKEGPEIRMNGNGFIQDLDSVGLPAWDLMPPSTYPRAPHGAFYRNFPVAPIVISRGCPYPCAFCSARTISGSKIRTRSVDNVIEELSMLRRRFGVREFHIEDDNFTLNRDYVEHFCETLLQKDIRMTWAFPNGIRLDTIEREMLRLMKRAGCYGLNFGVESGSPRILKMIEKKIDLALVRERLAMAREEGFDIGAFFIIGFPTETRQEMRETIRVALSLPLDRIGISYFQPFPGSPIYEQLLEQGEISADWADHHHTTLHNLTYVSSSTTREELRGMRKRFLVTFYFRPVILKGLLGQVRSPSQLYYMVKRGIRWLKA